MFLLILFATPAIAREIGYHQLPAEETGLLEEGRLEVRQPFDEVVASLEMNDETFELVFDPVLLAWTAKREEMVEVEKPLPVPPHIAEAVRQTEASASEMFILAILGVGFLGVMAVLFTARSRPATRSL